MIKNKKILLILVGIIVIILTGFVLLNQQSPVKQEEEISLNILDGVIEDINYENLDSFVAKINTADISGISENPIEKVIRLDEVTEWTIYDQNKGEEASADFTRAKEGDHILIFSLESPESINDLEQFTALKVMIFK